MARAKTPKPKKSRKSFADMLGLKTEAKQTENDKAQAEIQRLCEDGYWFLRQMLDRAVVDFYRTGEFTKLEELVERPALDALKAQLSDLRSRRILWVQPERSKRKPKLTVIPTGLVTNRRGQPTRFIIEERFVDRSVHQYYVKDEADHQEECPGRERVIRATVDVHNGQTFKLRSVAAVPTGA